MGSGERYHSYLRNVFSKVKDAVNKICKEDALRLDVKAVNDTVGTYGLVPTLLVFWSIAEDSSSSKRFA